MKNWSLLIHSLASFDYFADRNLFQIGANDMSKMVNIVYNFCQKATNFV